MPANTHIPNDGRNGNIKHNVLSDNLDRDNCYLEKIGLFREGTISEKGTRQRRKTRNEKRKKKRKIRGIILSFAQYKHISYNVLEGL